MTPEERADEAIEKFLVSRQGKPLMGVMGLMKELWRQARADALREAAEIARNSWRANDDPTWTCNFISDSILALIEKEKGK